jgi:hypothetical protein
MISPFAMLLLLAAIVTEIAMNCDREPRNDARPNAVPIDEEACGFYRKLGVLPVLPNPWTLALPLDTVKGGITSLP